MKRKIIVLLLFTLALFSCTRNIKPTPRSRVPQIRVLLGNIGQRDSLLLHGKFKLQLEEAAYELGRHNPFFYLSLSRNGFKMYNSNRLFVFNAKDIVHISPADPLSDRFKFRNKWYKGKIILRLSDEGKLSLINSVDLESYLKSVVSGEMPSSKKGYLEALKAQAICARTYALNKMNARIHQPFDVYGDINDQVYAGLNRQTKLATQAVEATRGVVLQYQDTLAQIYFHSTCGGISEDPADLWGQKNSPPYLKVRKDVLGDQFACRISPSYRWQRRFSFRQIDSLFARRFNYSFLTRPVTDTLHLQCRFKVLQRTGSGRVKQLQISYADTTVTLQNFEIRSFFSKFNQGALPSLLFTLSSEDDSVLVINGGGYGHGIGLCQWGALNMSLQGFKYYDILVNQYFPGTYLKRIY